MFGSSNIAKNKNVIVTVNPRCCNERLKKLQYLQKKTVQGQAGYWNQKFLYA